MTPRAETGMPTAGKLLFRADQVGSLLRPLRRHEACARFKLGQVRVPGFRRAGREKLFGAGVLRPDRGDAGALPAL